jgi:hypothetical protein
LTVNNDDCLALNNNAHGFERSIENEGKGKTRMTIAAGTLFGPRTVVWLWALRS